MGTVRVRNYDPQNCILHREVVPKAVTRIYEPPLLPDLEISAYSRQRTPATNTSPTKLQHKKLHLSFKDLLREILLKILHIYSILHLPQQSPTTTRHQHHTTLHLNNLKKYQPLTAKSIFESSHSTNTYKKPQTTTCKYMYLPNTKQPSTMPEIYLAVYICHRTTQQKNIPCINSTPTYTHNPP